MREIVIAGGGTGGHLFPGLAVAAELHRAGAPVSWLGAERGLEAVRVPQAGLPIALLPVTGAVGRSRASQAGAALRLVPATAAAVAHLMRRQAGAVLSVGGYAALPGALAASLLGLPVILQEQNAVPGLTHRILAPWAVAIACGFRAAVAAFPSLPATWTGNPVREEFFAVGAPPSEPAVLVLGGSQGAAVLNRTVPEALAILARTVPLPRVVHQAGPRWEEEVRGRYAGLGIEAEVSGFLERPWEALAASSLVVARSGALAVSEIAAASRPAVLVPFAAAAHGHQLGNARALEATGAAVVLEESGASPVSLAVAIAGLLAHPETLAVRGALGSGLARKDAAGTVARMVLSRAVGAAAAGGAA